MVIKMFVWSMHDGFYTHCYFFIQLLFAWNGVMWVFWGWGKMCGVCVCTLWKFLKCENYISEKIWIHLKKVCQVSLFITTKDNFKVAKMHWQKMILRKKKFYFEEELGKNWNKPKKLCKTLKSLGLSSDKAIQSKISLKKDDAI